MKIILTNGESIKNIKEIDFLKNYVELEYYVFNSKIPVKLGLKLIESILYSDCNTVYEKLYTKLLK